MPSRILTLGAQFIIMTCGTPSDCHLVELRDGTGECFFLSGKKKTRERKSESIRRWLERSWRMGGVRTGSKGEGGGKQFWNRWACLIFSADQNKLDYVRVPCFALNSWNIRRCDPPSSLPPELSPRFTTNSERKSEFNCHRLDGSRRTAEVVEAAHFSPLKMASRPETWPLAVFLFFSAPSAGLGWIDGIIRIGRKPLDSFPLRIVCLRFILYFPVVIGLLCCNINLYTCGHNIFTIKNG